LGFGDASGTGLGATFTCGTGFTFRIGVWGSLEKDESSNWKEFTNVVESLEEEAEAGRLEDSEVFMFTDNATVLLVQRIVLLPKATGSGHSIKGNVYET
jgi:hypothetical protein